MIRSINAKILLWVVVSVAIAVIGILATSFVLMRRMPSRVDFIAGTIQLQTEGARRAFDEGGTEQLQAYLKRLDELFQARHTLVSADGHDLIEGTDLAPLLALANHPPRPPLVQGGMAILSSPPEGDLPRLVVRVRPPPPGNIVPYLLWILFVIATLGFILTLHIARPLHAVRLAVEEFGAGNLCVRIQSRRLDEIGQVARAFDEMAARIETLLAAERRLLQDVSHELRSPLARIKFAIELARSSPDPVGALNRISRDVDRLSTLVGELLELTRAEGDPQARVRQLVDLKQLLEQLVEDSQLEASAKDCHVSLTIDDLVETEGEAELLRRAIENVVRNAIRFAPSGSEVSVGLAFEAELGRALVTVRDRGVGVPDDALSAIFQPFYRVANDRSRRSGGTGLGLAIARRAIALHDGRIQASDAAPGLLVTIALPGRLSHHTGQSSRG